MSVLAESRARARVWLSRGGDRVAGFDARPGTHRLILRALPLAMQKRFDPAMADDLKATLELRIRDPAGGAPAAFEINIADHRCTVRAGPAPEPGAAAELGADDIIRLVSGGTGWPALLAAGRLEMSGDPFLALRFPLLFRLPAEAG
jgi:hypothetical protein